MSAILNRDIVMKTVFLFCLLVQVTFSTTHVFWYNCIKKNYGLQENPGPNLPVNIIKHEGWIISGSGSPRDQSRYETVFAIGEESYNRAKCAYIWSADLNNMNGNCSKAALRAEYFDGKIYSNYLACKPGPIYIRLGIVDFTGNLDAWGGANQIPINSRWADGLNPLNSDMGFNPEIPSLFAQETLTFIMDSARSSLNSNSKLDKKFVEIDVTEQVNWILSHTGKTNPLKVGDSASYAIAFLVKSYDRTVGSFFTYSHEDSSFPGGGSDLPWTTDGNTVHLVVESDNLTPISAEKRSSSPFPGAIRGSVHPNPFKGIACISYNMGLKTTGTVSVFSPNGKLVSSQPVSGQGQLIWDASKRPEGLYICKLEVNGWSYSTTVVLLR